MSTTHEILTQVIDRNQAVDPAVSRLMRYVTQRGLPNVAYCTAAQTVVGTTLTASTYLNIANSVGYNSGSAVVGGRTYRVEGKLFLTSTASNGVKFDIAAGTAAATAVNGVTQIIAAAAIATSSITALNTSNTSTSTALEAVFDVTFVATSSGSLALQFAEAANSTGVILRAGSYMALTEIAQPGI